MTGAADELAILGGTPVLPDPLAPYRSVGRAELEAVTRVLESGCLSGFHGTWCDEFHGGPAVRGFEQAWCDRFQVSHAVTVNSATSGLYAAMGAIGIGAGDEVIVSPLTMSASAVAPLIYGGTPVFADIEPETFCLDPAAVRRAITPRTRAIIAVNLFGHPARLDELRAIAREHDLRLIEDNAQAPLAAENGRYAGTTGDIGVFSLNCHKHIQAGEGGVCVTDDDDLGQRLQLIRNHGENIVEPLGLDDLAGLVGFNFRMTELTAAVGMAQLERIDEHVGRREALAQQLTGGVQDLAGLTPPVVRPGCRHVYYVWALRFDRDVMGVSREQFSRALAAEGFPHAVGYVRPLYHLPLFRQRTGTGRYECDLCPVAERMHEKELLIFEPCAYDVDARQAELLVQALRKVHEHRHALIEQRERAKERQAYATHHRQH